METLVSLSLQATSSLEASPSPAAQLSGLSSLTAVSGIVTTFEEGLFYASKYVGIEKVPHDIKQLRRQVYDLMRRMGEPVIIKHMFNDEDVQAGIAKPSPNFDNIYGQTRNNDPLSYGVGLVSVETSENEWINKTDGSILVADDQPGSNYELAPKYRGYGPGYVTYIIEPDRPEDVFKLDPSGALIRVQQAYAQMGWFPKVNDNDLVINVILDKDGRVYKATERFQAKMTNPITIRGRDRRGKAERYGDRGNRHLVNQQFEMNRVPSNSVLMNVEVDR